MQRSRSVHPLSLLIVALCLLSLALAAYPTVATVAESGSVEAAVEQVRAEDAVEEAWERAREAGSYRYTADVVQRTLPKPTVTNIGRTSKQAELRLEGETSLTDQTLHLHLWSQGGATQRADSGVEVRIEGDRALARQGMGPWEEIDDFTEFFAPQGDFMTFLSAAKDIADQGTETRQVEFGVGNSEFATRTLQFTRYTFQVDGLGYATYLCDQIQQHLADKGELPPGVDLDLPRQYVDMTGEGELWIGSDGLPLRQILHLDMPERPDVRITAEVKVDFSDFGFAQQAAEAGGGGEAGSGGEKETRGLGALTGSLRALAGDHPERMLQHLLGQAALFTSSLALILLVALNSRSKVLYAALALALIASMVFTPLLQSLQAASFSERQAQRAQEQAARQEENDMARTLRELQVSEAASRDPHTPIQPLSAAAERPALSLAPPTATGGQPDLGAISVASDNSSCDGDSGLDSDGDGLTDCQEELVGTNPDATDTDGDLITDTLEVQGFEYDGQMWYTDPLEVDTNKDGIGDFLEWNVPDTPHATWDLDGDLTPDLFDRDNDGDGVPDHLDISPATKSDTIFDYDHPLSLILNKLTPDKPTYVEFHVRPDNPDHLWYAYNVLDWPEGDRQGQIHDADGKTFYDVDSSTALSPNDNGDLKLVPMLEIRFTGQPTNLPTQGELAHYGIFVQPLDEAGNEQAAYVPLHLITADDGEGRTQSRVAFYGKMLYRPELSWGNAQQVRLVWVVQALVDICADDGYKDGMCKEYKEYNQVQVIHAYYDEWTLTGLSVREDHGVDVAFVYEDPGVDDDLRDDYSLFALSHGLDYSFLAARDADSVSGRDITVDEINRRFDHTTNAGVSDQERWGISNTLSVETHFYEHLDVAMATIPMTDTKELLERVFTPHWSSSAPITPSLMIAREERYRATNLDLEPHTGNVVWDGRELTVDLPPSGADGVQVQTLAGMSWAPYRFRAGWEACPIDVYWDELARRYPFPGEADPDVAAGKTFGMQMYYLALYRGAISVVQMGDLVLEQEESQLDDVELNAWRKVYRKRILIEGIFEGFIEAAQEYNVWKEFGKILSEGAKKAWAITKERSKFIGRLAKRWQGGGWSKGVVIGLAVAAIGAFVVWLVSTIVTTVSPDVAWAKWTALVMQVVLEALFQLSVIGAVTRAIKDAIADGLSGFRAITSAMGSSTCASTAAKVAAAIGLIISLGLIWVTFFVEGAKMGWGGIEFNMLVAHTVAATLVAVLLFVLALDIVGLIIVAILALVDLVAWLGFGEKGPLGWFTWAWSYVFYHAEPIADVEKVDMGKLNQSLADPALGLSVGNELAYSTTMTTTIVQNLSYASPYFSVDEMKDTTFNYKLAPGVLLVLPGFPEIRFPVGHIAPASLGTMRHLWSTWRFCDFWGSYDQDCKHRARARKTARIDPWVELRAGVNHSVPLYLLTSYAMPGQECVLGIICWDHTFTGTDAQYMDDLVLDVFPETLAEFHAMGWHPDLPGPRDGDGDGLLSAAFNGPDPDDRSWDTDGDGLSDAYELELRQAGVGVDPENPDTDGDTLSDADEVRLGSDPNKEDTDNDGLPDGVEVFHRNSTGSWEGGWVFQAGGLSTRVTSDPRMRDTDGDGINDQAERALLLSEEGPYHPRVWNESPLALYAEISDADGYVYPGQTFAYTATVRNNFGLPLYAHGDLVADYPVVLGVTRTMDVDGPVYEIVVSGDDVYVGGDFTVAGGVSANNVARWDKSTDTWSALGSGVNGPVYAIAVSGDDVYVGGSFSTADGESANNIARWNRTTGNWSTLGGVVTGTVRAMAVSGNDVYVGGEFTEAGGVSANHVARWDGTGWVPLGGGVNDTVRAIAVGRDDVYVGGDLTTAGGGSANRIARWNQTTETWSPLASGVDDTVYAIAVSGGAGDSGDVYAGGDFTDAGSHIARWNSATGNWSALASGLNDTVRAIAVSTIGDVYAGGDFTDAGSHVARWTGTAWGSLDSGVGGTVHAVTADGSQVYVGGGFATAGGEGAQNLAGWNDLLDRWAWPDQTLFTIAQEEEAHITRTLTADSTAHTQHVSVDSAQRSKFNPLESGNEWSFGDRRVIVWPAEAGTHPWHTAVAAAPGEDAPYRVAALGGDIPDAWYSLRFDGVDDYVEANSVASAVGAGAISFGAWVYPAPGLTRQEGLLGFHDSAGGNRNLLLYRTGRFQYYDDTTGWVNSAGTFAPDQWYHVMAVIDAGNNGTLYVNGVPEASFTTSVRPDAGGRFSIGQEWDSGSETSDHFKGLIDEARVWSVARTQAEIRADMYRVLTGALPGGLEGYWRFDEGSGITATDQTADGNDGTLVNFDQQTAWDENSAPSLNNGRIAVNTADEDGFSSTPITVDDGSHAKYPAPPDIACANDGPGGSAGPCLVAWSEEHDGSFDLYGAIISPTLGGVSAGTPFSITRGVDSVRPAVASDGSDFLVAWERPSADAGYALRFDGVDDYVDLPDMNPDYSGGFTVEAWVYYESFKSWSRIIDLGNGRDADNVILANRGTSNTLDLDVYQGSSRVFLEAPVLEIGEWAHVAATVDGAGNAKLYKNGVAVAESSDPQFVPNTITRTNSYIGRSNWIEDEHFDGLIDEVRLWNVARTQDQIRADMNQALTGSEPGLVAYWRFDEGSGLTATDQTASGNDGTLLPSGNGPVWTPDDGQIHTRVVSSTGELSGAERWLHAGKDDRHVDLAWAGDRTIVVWENLSGSSGPDVWAAYLNADGTYVSDSAQAVAATGASEELPQVAYNPDTGEALVTYRTDNESVDGRLVRNVGVSSEFTIGSRDPGGDLYNPHVAFDSGHAGWLAAWSGRTDQGTPVIDFQALVGDPAEPGYALRFDGVDDYVDLPDMNPDYSGGFTVEAWVYYESFKSWSRIIDLGNGRDADNIVLANRGISNTLDLDVYQGSSRIFLEAPVLEIGEWAHVAATVDGAGNAKLYKNGVAVAESSDPQFVPNTITRTNNYIGRSNWSEDEHFDGLIDEVRLWNVARTQDQISAGMNWRLTGTEPGLVAYWRFDEGSGLTATDATGYGHDGTLLPSGEGPVWDTAGAPFLNRLARYRAVANGRHTWLSELSAQGTSLACTQPLGPRALWLRLDEAAGATTFADTSGNGNAGSCTGDACPAAGLVGRVGAAARFDGEDDHVEANLVTQATDDVSLAAWIKWAGTNNGPQIVVYNGNTSLDGYGLYMSSSGQLSILNGGVEFATTNVTPTVDVWQHIAAVREKGEWKLYLNGTQMTVTSNPSPNLPFPPYGATTVGANQDGTENFNGFIDEVTIYNHALSAGQVADLYRGRAASDDDYCALTTNVALGDDSAHDIYLDQLQLSTALPWMGTIESPQPVTTSVWIDADPPTTSTVTSLSDGQYVRCAVEQIPTYTLIIGGQAEDAVSGVGTVEVQVDGGEWQPATGAEIWAYEWQIGAMSTIMGEHTIRTRAVDNVGNVFTEALGIRVVVDVDWPDVDTPIESGTIFTATRDAQGRWTVPLHGTAEDAIYYGVTTPPGSGVRSVEVLLEGSAGVAGRAWQTATLTQDVDTWNWNIDYVLPFFNNESETMVDPTGEYTFLTRATDEVANRTSEPFYLGIPIRIDNTAPIAVITDTGSATALITRPLDISGVFTDPGVVAKGVGDLEIAYTPAQVAHALSSVALLLHLDETAGATTFDDASGNRTGSCTGGSCPVAGGSGRSGAALEFDGVDDYVAIGAHEILDLGGEFTLAAWVSPTIGYGQEQDGHIDVLSRWGETGAGGAAYLLGLNSAGQVLLWTHDGSFSSTLASSEAITVEQWSHIVGVREGSSLKIYINGHLDSQLSEAVAPQDSVYDLRIGAEPTGGNHFAGTVDQVAVFRGALSESEVETLYDSVAQSWLDWRPATLAQAGVGITRTTWSHTVPGSVDGHDPAGLEGIYQIDLRGTDELGNRNDRRADWGAWQGEIDTLAPSVDVEYEHWGTDQTARTVYRCWAEDLNLDTVQCPCPILPSDRHTFDAPWWRAWFSDTTRLYRVQTSCIVKGHRPASEATVQARDRFDHLSAYSPMMAPRAVLARTPPVDSAIFTPTYGTLLTTTVPISVEGGAWVKSGLKGLTVTVDGTPIYTPTWPTPYPFGVNWATTYTPTAEGPHTLASVAVDALGMVQTRTHPITVTLDTQPPVIRVPAAVLTSVHRLSYGRVALTGPYTEAGGVDAIRVQANVHGQGLDNRFDAAALDQAWRYAWDLGEEPDGQIYTVTAVITDVVGDSAQGSNTVLVDLVPPAPVTVTLAYTNSDGVYTSLTPWETVRDVSSPTLVITWTASDSADLSHYYAGWTQEQVGQVGNLSYHGTAAARRHEQTTGEAQALYAHVVAQDVRGNQQWQTLGPIYTDVISTPDYIADPSAASGQALAYHGWTESGGSQIGADRELERNAQDGQAVTGIQRFYVTWDADALRLAWTGADWNNDGDLFVYFDTVEPGGATRAYNPYNPPMTITLPAQGGHQLEADYLIWVEDASTAELRYWSGSDWVISGTLSSDQYKLDTTLAVPVTDLRIPFDLLSISNPAAAALKLVALASEEETLRLWAAMPEKNPLNSERVLNTPGGPLVSHQFALTQQYEWTSLELDLVPNADQFTDADLLVDVTADPPGVEVGYLEHDLLYLMPWALLDADLDGEPDMDLPMDTDPDLVGQGQLITYIVNYANEGTEVAPGVHVTVTARGALQLNSNPLVLNLGDVGADTTATLQFTGTVDTSIYTQSVEVDAVVADATHGPFDWLWIQHDVDTAAPEDVEIVAPLRYVKPYTNTVRGTVYDPSGVPTITLAAQPLQAGTPFTTTCTDGTPDDGQWACAWDIGAANNGDRFRLRPLATDRFGNGPTVGDWVTLTVDAFPPTITLDAVSEIALQGAVLGPGGQILLTGQVEDDQQAHAAGICFALAYGQSCEDIQVYPGDDITGTWSYALGAVGELDNELQDFSLYGVDGAGNRSAPLTYTYGVDNVPPVITVTLWVDYLPAPSPTQILGGTVSDGGGVSEMYVSVEAPEGDTSWDTVAPVGEAWSYTLSPETVGIYSLWIQARDPKGNTSEEGPYRVSVGIKEVYLPLVLRNH